MADQVAGFFCFVMAYQYKLTPPKPELLRILMVSRKFKV